MLKLNASFSKKVPAEQEYSSQSYHAAVEVEIPDGLTQEQLQNRIHETFELVRSSVEAELGGTAQSLPQKQPNLPPPPPSQPPCGRYGNRKAAQAPRQEDEESGDKQASPKQVKYLKDLARKANINLAFYLKSYGLADVQELNRHQCSTLIDQIRGKKAA